MVSSNLSQVEIVQNHRASASQYSYRRDAQGVIDYVNCTSPRLSCLINLNLSILLMKMFEKLDEKRLQISFFKFTQIVNLKNFASELLAYGLIKRGLPPLAQLSSETIAGLK